jgi:hypothetical protein
MSKRPFHWLDELAEEVYGEVERMAEHASESLRGRVPLGMTRLTQQEKAYQYMMVMNPEQRAALGAQDPSRVSALESTVIEQLGMAGAALIPYLAPYRTGTPVYPEEEVGDGSEFA